MLKYLVAIILPPVALLMVGKIFQFVLNLIFCIISLPLMVMFGVGIIIWLLCIAHAFLACVEHDREKHERMAHLAGTPQVMEQSTPPAPPLV
jgi:hypothetical protein